MSSPALVDPPTDPRSLRRVVGAGFAGTAIEYYDFFIYGTAAALVFPRAFFPELGSAAATSASFATFSVAFLARPFGGIVFGHLGDRIGRKSTLVATLTIMGAATALIGLLPDGDAIGVAAPLLLIALRIVQGLAVGGEWSSAALFVAEYAPPEKRARYALSPTLGTLTGLLLSSLTFLVTGLTMSNGTFTSWGWRIPFLLSVVLVAFGLWVRLGVADTPVFRAAQAQAREVQRAKLPLAQLLRHQRKETLLAAGATFVWQPFSTMGAVYLINYGTATLGLSRNTMLVVSVASIAFGLAGCLTAGRLAEQIGRRRTILLANWAGLAWSFALFPLASAGGVILIGASISVTLFIVGMAATTMAAFIPETFRTAYRSSGASVSFNLGAAIGGSIPAIAAASLIANFGSIGISLMLAAFAFIAVVSATFLQETRGGSLVASAEVGVSEEIRQA